MISTKHNVQSYFTICPLTKAREQQQNKYFFLLLKEGKKNKLYIISDCMVENICKASSTQNFYNDERKRKKYLTKQKSEIDFFFY